MKLSILIASIPSRNFMLNNLCNELSKQIDKLCISDEIEIRINSSVIENIGKKRNALLALATGDYLCFFDDDDLPGKNYLKHIMDGIEKGVDCISLRGEMTTDGINPEIFEHSIKYALWKTNSMADPGTVKYERYPNHLNAIKSGIAKQHTFPEIAFGEDHRWSAEIARSGEIKTEHYVDEIIYYYQYVSNKKIENESNSI